MEHGFYNDFIWIFTMIYTILEQLESAWNQLDSVFGWQDCLRIFKDILRIACVFEMLSDFFES